MNNKNFGIIISHGHDDHCDDSFLEKLSTDIPFFIPDYKSIGMKKRISSKGFENIIEINGEKGANFGPFTFSSDVVDFESEDNAIIGIYTKDYSFIHANDCSIPLPKNILDALNSKSKTAKVKYFASQTNRANCWPYQYPQIKDSLSNKEFEKLVLESIQKTIQRAVDNANYLKSDVFISYAGYTAAIPLLMCEPPVQQFFPSPSNIKKLNLDWSDVQLSDAMPGDVIDTMSKEVIKPFWNRLSSLEDISKKFLERKRLTYKEILPDKYYDESMMTTEELIGWLQEYMKKFNDFVLKSFDNNLPKELKGKVFRISIEDIGKSVTLTLGESDQKHNDDVVPTKEMIIDRARARALVVGKMNFESFYVGFNGTFKRNPVDVHNVLLIGFLQKFAYVYQKRLVPKSLEEIK